MSLVWRKQIVLPAEHGSWSWLLVPFLVGVGVAGVWNTAVSLTLLGSLAAFLMRQPATVWLRVRQGRANKANAPIARAWVLLFGTIASLCLIGLLLSNHLALLWLLLPIGGILLVYITAVRQRRSLGMELAGAAGLAVTSAAVLIVVDGRFSTTALILWLLLAAQNALGALYVRLRIADTHKREMGRTAVLIPHLLTFLLLLAAGFLNIAPLLAALPFLGFLLRAAWLWSQPRPIANIKRFGFAEIGVELISGLILILSYQLRQ
ncbi:MAG: YwiC-like family protein [Ardenticatenaceae bacterium]|nr:YwiC-like family protein [Ardenticatenaceae bacterium]